MKFMLKRSTLWTFNTFLAISIVSATSSWALDAKNFDQIKTALGFSPYYKSKMSKKRTVKIAVFDNGFHDYEKQIGSALPENTTYVNVKPKAPCTEEKSTDGTTNTVCPADDTTHGRFMAEILNALMTNNGENTELEPELYLFKVTSYNSLKQAIDDSIQLKIDIILHSMVRELGGNFDGKGFFNAQTNRATEAGIIWVNAAGNFGKLTYNLSNFTTDADGWVNLPGPNNTIPIRCEEPKDEKEKCQLRINLTWNDFKDDPEIGTNKDLDIVLLDDTLNMLAISNLTQTTEEVTSPAYTKYPRDVIDVEVLPGRYLLRVKNRSLNFSKTDSLRITAEGDFISMEDFDKSESLSSPADNPNVITVGASDSDRSSVSKKLNKPEIFAPSLIEISKNEAFLGSSNSAAIVAAGVGLLKMHNPDLKREDIIELMTTIQYQNLIGEGLPTEALLFGPTLNSTPEGNQFCFEVAELNRRPPVYIQHVLSRGGVFVKTTAGLRIATPFDPINLSRGLQRMRADDMVLMTPQGLIIRPRYEMINVPTNWAEVFQLPEETSTCTLPQSWMSFAQSAGKGQAFKMPNPTELKK